MIDRYINKDTIEKHLKPNRALLIYGPRRVGKTTALKHFLKKYKGKYIFETGEDIQLREVLQSQSKQKIISYFHSYDLVVIDEAQKIEGIGLGLKLLVDHIEGIKVIATGSSSFDLANKIGEPLTGRHTVLTMYPISLFELSAKLSPLELDQQLNQFLIYGLYPEALTIKGNHEKAEYLKTLVESYLYKDILEFADVRNSKKIIDLLRLIAFQIGHDVSINELANNLNISRSTVDRYLDLLEKTFVVYNVRGFSRNLRKEIAKTSRYYFFDNGVLNTILSNMNPLKLREDIGRLWENFIFMERIKKRAYNKEYANIYFWRTYNQKEIDLIEERGGKLYGYEFKWKPKTSKAPKDWIETYDNASYNEINKENFIEFIT